MVGSRGFVWVRTIGFFAFLFVSAAGALAQTPSATPSPTPVKQNYRSLEREFFRNIARDQKGIWTAPFRWHGSDARWLAPLGFGTAAFIATDQRTGDGVAKTRRLLNASRIVSYAGAGYGAGVTAVGFYLFGRATHNTRARETGVLGAEALIDSVMVVTALKEITQRSRPTAGRTRSDFFDGGTSFPSGHSIQAWSVATVIAHEYHDRPAVQIAAYGIASAVSVARFTGQNHYLSDILVGSALGYGIGRYVYKTHHRQRPAAGGTEEEEETFVSHRWPLIAPQYNRHASAYGVALIWRF